MNPGGSKMSKRDKAKAARQAANDASLTTADSIESPRFAAFMDGDNNDNDIALAIAMQLGLQLPEIDVDDFKQAGYLPQVCLNYIALLGWNPGNDLERFDLDFLKQHFDLDRIGKSNSTFDRDKLKAFNGDTLRAMDEVDFACLLADYVKAYRPEWESAGVFNGDDWQSFCTAVQERTHTLPDPLDANAYLIADDHTIAYDFAPKPIRKAMTNSDGSRASNCSKNSARCLMDCPKKILATRRTRRSTRPPRPPGSTWASTPSRCGSRCRARP